MKVDSHLSTPSRYGAPMPVSGWKACLAEGIATFGLTFIGAGAICANQYSGGEIGLVGIALAQSAALVCMIYATRHVSGGHVNPAVTLAVAINGHITPRRAGMYVAAQLAGASIGGFVLAALYTPEVWEPVALGTPVLSPEVAFSTGIFIEALLTFFLVFTMLQVTLSGSAPDNVHGLAVGVVLIAGILVAGPLTGAAMNPARAFGPALASGVWSNHLIYWIGPASGGVAAALANRLVRPARSD